MNKFGNIEQIQRHVKSMLVLQNVTILYYTRLGFESLCKLIPKHLSKYRNSHGSLCLYFRNSFQRKLNFKKKVGNIDSRHPYMLNNKQVENYNSRVKHIAHHITGKN